MTLEFLGFLVFGAPLGILAGFVCLGPRWNKALLLLAALTVLTTGALLEDDRNSWLPIVPLVMGLQLFLMVGAICLGLALRMAFNIWLTRRGRKGVLSTSGNRWPDIVFGCTMAAYLPWFMAYAGAFARVDGRVLFISFGIIIVVALAAFVVLFRRDSHAHTTIAAAWAISLSALTFYALVTGAKLQTTAETFAQDRAYCIQSGNAAVTEIWDLTVLNLRAVRRLNYHALMVIRENDANQFYNWSYQRGQFMPGKMTYQPDVICSPKITP